MFVLRVFRVSGVFAYCSKLRLFHRHWVWRRRWTEGGKKHSIGGFHRSDDLRMDLNMIMLQKNLWRLHTATNQPADNWTLKEVAELLCSQRRRLSLAQYSVSPFSEPAWTRRVLFYKGRRHHGLRLLISLQLHLKQFCGVNLFCSTIDLLFGGEEENFLETSCKIFCLRKWKTCFSEK